jgi:hypothetical protein
MSAQFEASTRAPWERHNAWMRVGDLSVNASAHHGYVGLFVVHGVVNTTVSLTPDQAKALGAELLACGLASESAEVAA